MRLLSNFWRGCSYIDTSNANTHIIDALVIYFLKAANEGTATTAATAGGDGHVAAVVERSDFETAIGGAHLTVVDFWAPWCKNCKKIMPQVAAMAAAMPAVKFLKINTVDAEPLAHDLSIDALPTFHFYKAGKKVGEFKGSDASKLEADIKKMA